MLRLHQQRRTAKLAIRLEQCDKDGGERETVPAMMTRNTFCQADYSEPIDFMILLPPADA